MRPFIAFLCIVVTVGLFVDPAKSQAPNLINFQAQLADGGSLPSPLEITFSIYPNETGGSSLWNEVQSVSQVSGAFSVLLGSVSAFPENLFSVNGTRYLEISIPGQFVMERFQLTSVAFAKRAQTADEAGPSGLKFSDGSVQTTASTGDISMLESLGVGIDQINSFPAFNVSILELVGNQGQEDILHLLAAPPSQVPYFVQAKAEGTTDALQPISVPNAGLGLLGTYGYDGTTLLEATSIYSSLDGAAAPGSMPGQMAFWTNSGGSFSSPKMTIRADGKVGIGTTSPESTLHVNGDISVPQGGRFILGVPSTFGEGEWIGNSALGIGLVVAFEERARVGGLGLNARNLGLEHSGARGALFLAGMGDFNHALYNNLNDIDGKGSSDVAKWNVFGGLEVMIGAIPNQRIGLRVEGNGRVTIPGNNDTDIGTMSPALIDLAIDDNDSGLNVPSDGNLAFFTDNVERMRINAAGWLGIGTSSPTVPLDVVGTSGSFRVHPIFGEGPRSSTLLGGWQSELFAPQVRFEGPAAGFIDIGNNADGNFVVEGSDTERFIVENTGDVVIPSGNLGVGTISPGFPIDLASGAHVTVGGVWTDASSRELKENIADLSQEEALDVILALDPVRYNYKVDPADEYLGFIAEDVPDLVATKDRKSLSPMDIVAALTKVVQQQQRQIEDLRARLDAGR